LIINHEKGNPDGVSYSFPAGGSYAVGRVLAGERAFVLTRSSTQTSTRRSKL